MGFGRSRNRAKAETPRSDVGVAPDNKNPYPISYENRARNALKYYEDTHRYEQQRRDDRDCYNGQPTSDPGMDVERRQHRQPQGWDQQECNDDDEYYDDHNENDEPRTTHSTTLLHRKTQPKDYNNASNASNASDTNHRYVLQRSNSSVSHAASSYSNAALDGFVAPDENNKPRRRGKAGKIKKLFRRNKSGGDGIGNNGKNNNNGGNGDEALEDLAGAPYEIITRRKKKKDKRTKGPSSALTTERQLRKLAGGERRGYDNNDTMVDAVNGNPEAAAASQQGRRHDNNINAPLATCPRGGGSSPGRLNVTTPPNPWAEMTNPPLRINNAINIASPNSIATISSHPRPGTRNPPSGMNNAIDIASPNSITTEIYSHRRNTYSNPFLDSVPIDIGIDNTHHPPTPLNLNGSYNLQGSGMPSIKWWTWKRPPSKESYLSKKSGTNRKEEETVFAFMCMFPQA